MDSLNVFHTLILKQVFRKKTKSFFKNWSTVFNRQYEGFYVAIGNPAFYLFLYLTSVNVRGELQHVCGVSVSIDQLEVEK